MSGPVTTASLLVLVSLAGLRAGAAGWCRAAVTARLASLSGRGPGEAGAPHAGAAPPRVLTPPAWLAPRLLAAGVGADPGLCWTGWMVASAGLVTVALMGFGPGAALLAACSVVAGPALAWRLLRHRGAARLESALPGAVEAVAAGLRSGASLRQALAEAARATPGALGDDLAAVTTATERGAGLVAALEGWAVRRPLSGVRLVVAALCVGAETGGAAARAVDGVAATLRQRLAADAEALALATQARVSAAVIAVAPLAFGALAAVTDARSAGFLLRTPAGLVMLSAGLSLDAAGALWMARLTRVQV